MSNPRYDRQFKEHFVKKILNDDETITQIAQKLEIHYSIVRDWVRQYKKDGNNAFPESGNLKAEGVFILLFAIYLFHRVFHYSLAIRTLKQQPNRLLASILGVRPLDKPNSLTPTTQ